MAGNSKKSAAGRIVVGIGGWNYDPWHETFYPPGLSKAKELGYASRQVTSIEVNGTFYRTQTPDSFKRWADETPDDFVFSLKAPRYAVNRRILAEAGPSIDIFLKSGLHHLKSKLGPILWQFAGTKKFDAEDFAGFVALLPPEIDGIRLRHALEVRHDSFVCAEFVALAAKHKAAIVFAESDDHPMIADITADFVYARLQRSEAALETGYKAPALNKWAEIARNWSRGEPPKEPALLGKPKKPAATDAFVYFISGAKERNPAAAMALLKQLG